MTGRRPVRKGLRSLVALVAAAVLAIAAIYLTRSMSGSSPDTQPSPHAINQTQ
jgi:hypothetical protein